MGFSGMGRMFTSQRFDRLAYVIRNGTQGGRERKGKSGESWETGIRDTGTGLRRFGLPLGVAAKGEKKASHWGVARLIFFPSDEINHHVSSRYSPAFISATA